MNKKEDNLDDSQHSSEQVFFADDSFSSLIIWNISKAIKKNPALDLKLAIRKAKERLECDVPDVYAMMSNQEPAERYLTCALLAWQQLGHKDVESLCRFIEESKESTCSVINSNQDVPNDGENGTIEEIHHKNQKICQPTISNHDITEETSHLNKNNYDTIRDSKSQLKLESTLSSARRWPSYKPRRSKKEDLMGYKRSAMLPGPVLRLPYTTSVVMRLDNNTRPHPYPQPPKKITVQKEQDIMKKINEVCCLESGCVERLAKMEATTRDLRQRATKLAQREAERVALLERAEAAWRDLELNYQRRLRLSLEKEEDIARQMKKMIEERNGFKENCGVLVEQLKERSGVAEKERERLTAMEKELCGRACERLKVSEEFTREESALADNLCKAAQMDRDLQFKEEQARRKVQCLESAIEIARALKFEAGRAMHAELAGMRDQINLVSSQLLEEDVLISQVKEELDEQRQEKMEIIDDLEGCKFYCDGRLAENMAKLTKEREELEKLKEKVIECKCKMPVNVVVEAKRSPSLAALCDCVAEDRALETCSCTSLRGQLLSNLLADLFCGLQTELGMSGAQMPCQLLKCLEDKHNWDKASVVKANLKSFFSRLLVGELDIAIATAIEKYHARWIGTSCADPRLVPGPGDVLPEGWQQRVIERKAQQLAAKLAEQMFEQKADQLTQRAKDAMMSAAPPCDCKPNETQATFQCLLQSSLGDGMSILTSHSTNTCDQRPSWKRAFTDVTQLRLEVENLKKESIKKHDLMAMEREIAKLVLLSSEPSCEVLLERKRDMSRKNSPQAETVLNSSGKQVKNETRSTPIKKYGNTSVKNSRRQSPSSKATLEKQTVKSYRRPGQTYAVNVCFCSTKDPQKIKQKKTNKNSDEDKTKWQQSEGFSQMSGTKQAKPIAQLQSSTQRDYEELKSDKLSFEDTCKSSCICFNKIPSNTSIDKLLQALTNWTYKFSENYTDSKCTNKHVTEKQNLNGKNTAIYSKLNNDSFRESLIKKTFNDEAVLSYNIGNQTDQKYIELDGEFPLATDSEYMGAVNLDKSNEAFCKCQDALNNHENLKSQKITTSIRCIKSYSCHNHSETWNSHNANLEFPKHCVSDQDRNMEECRCKELHQLGELISDPLNADILLEQSHNVTKQEVNIFTSFKNLTKEIKEDLLKYLYDHQKIKSNTRNITDKEQNTFPPLPIYPLMNTDHKVQTSKCVTGDDEYRIEFLGVTLNNENIDSKNEKKISNIENICTQTQFSEENNLTKELQSQSFWHNIKKSFPCLCQCGTKLDEIKNVFDNNICKQQDNNNKYEDKGFDTESLTKIIKNQKSCICCPGTDRENSKDLEDNTFQLLEEHLKKKFEDLTLSSFCLPTKEEDKLYSALLQKIKHIIADSTDEVVCRCSEKQEIEGSWNRAYNLLQEYLKVKVSRVKCMCGTPSKDEEIVLNVVEKVCSLIEKDFQRLKNKCQNKKKQKQIPYTNESEIETPQNYTSTSDVNIVEDTLNIVGGLKYLDTSCSPTNDTITFFNNTLPTSRLENTGCDPVVYSNMLITTQELQVIGDQLDPNMESCSNINIDKVQFELAENGTTVQCAEVLSPNINNYISESNQNVSQVGMKEENHKLKRELTLPYIGYTVECSCDHKLGFCTCNRASVQRYNDDVQHIWHAFTSNRVSESFSYVMNNVHKKVDNVCNIDVIEDPLLINIAKVDNATQFSMISAGNICDIKTSYTEGDIVLKDSKTENRKQYKENATEIAEKEGFNVREVFRDDQMLQWYECGSQPNVTQQTKLKSVHFNSGNSDIAKKDTFLGTQEKYLSNTVTQDCNCGMVPICHVKMLVDNIENRLIHSECTCDSMSAKVCPTHSIQSNYIE